MSSAETQEANKKKKRRQRKKIKRGYYFDHDTLQDLAIIQAAFRAGSTAETVRSCIRRMARLCEYRGRGYEICAVKSADGRQKILVIDIPISQ